MSQKNDRKVISEVTLTLQGEGPFLGTPVLLVRFCEKEGNPSLMTTQEAIQSIKKMEAWIRIPRDFLFTGGEPLLYIKELEKIALYAYRVHIETDGRLLGNWIPKTTMSYVVAISPKREEGLNGIYPWVEEQYIRQWGPEIYFKFFVSLDQPTGKIRKDISRWKEVMQEFWRKLSKRYDHHIDRVIARIPAYIVPVRHSDANGEEILGSLLFFLAHFSSEIVPLRLTLQLHKLL